jgi:hypothetical protein
MKLTEPLRRPDQGTPRWVRLSGFAAIGVAVLVVVMLLAGHGPGRHIPQAIPNEAPPAPAAALR